MRSPRLRVRTWMFLVWLSALVFVGVAEVLDVHRMRNRVEIIEESFGPDGSSTARLRYGHTMFYRLGPLPLGPYPIAALSGAAFAASIGAWIAFSRRARINRPDRAV